MIILIVIILLSALVLGVIIAAVNTEKPRPGSLVELDRDYVGVWVVPGMAGSMVIQSDGTGFVTDGYDKPNAFKWRVEGKRIKMIMDKNQKEIMYAERNFDDNLVIYKTIDSTTPLSISIRQK